MTSSNSAAAILVCAAMLLAGCAQPYVEPRGNAGLISQVTIMNDSDFTIEPIYFANSVDCSEPYTLDPLPPGSSRTLNFVSGYLTYQMQYQLSSDTEEKSCGQVLTIQAQPGVHHEVRFKNIAQGCYATGFYFNRGVRKIDRSAAPRYSDETAMGACSPDETFSQ